MKLRVEIEWQGDPWRKKSLAQRAAFIDMLFGFALASLYIYKLSFPTHEPSLDILPPRDFLYAKLLLIFLVAANLIQSIHACRLFVIVRQKGVSPARCFTKARAWFDYTEFVILCSCVKCIASVGYLVAEARNCFVLLMTLLTVSEMFFKIYALYHVNDFMKDLKASMKYYPKIRFIPVSAIDTDETMQSLLSEDKHEGDVNANTEIV